MAGGLGEMGGDDRLGRGDGLVNRAMAPVDDRLGMSNREIRVVALVACVRR